jgi:hypothetical protein
MISDNDLPTSRFVSVPKSYGSFNPGGLVAGIIRGMLDTAGFPARQVAGRIGVLPSLGGGAQHGFSTRHEVRVGGQH